MSKNTTATLLLLLGTFFWGATFVFVKEGIERIDVFTFLAWRFSIASLLLILIFFRKIITIDRRTIKYGAFLGVILMASYTTQTVGLLYTTASKAAFITGLSVVFVPLFIAMGGSKRPTTGNILAVIIATIGLAILTLSSSFAFNIGDIWVLGCAFFFALYIILVGKYTRTFESIKFTLVQLITVTIISVIVSTARQKLVIPADWIVWQAIIITAIFATAYMYVIQNQFQKFITEVKAAIIFSFEPIFAAIIAYFYLNEPLTIRVIIGGALIFAGMLVSEWKKRGNVL